MTAVTNTTSAPNAGSSNTTQAQAGLNSNYQDFLKLLTTQLKNQDPSQPIDTNQLTAQIASLSQVEQQINMNSKLEQIIGLYNSSQASSAVSYIGKQVDASGNQIDLVSSTDSGGKTTSSAALVYNLSAAAKTASITIYDSTGNPVATSTGTTTAGRNQLVWNGKTASGTQAPAGVYTFKVTATDTAGKDVPATTYTTGIVTSVQTVSGVNQLSLGDFSIPLSSVQSIYNAGTNPGV